MPNPISKARKLAEEEFLESEPVKRLLSLDAVAIITGRAPQYSGVLLSEALRKSSDAILAAVVEMVRDMGGVQLLNKQDLLSPTNGEGEEIKV